MNKLNIYINCPEHDIKLLTVKLKIIYIKGDQNNDKVQRLSYGSWSNTGAQLS